jgi:hypothetical protein
MPRRYHTRDDTVAAPLLKNFHRPQTEGDNSQASAPTASLSRKTTDARIDEEGETFEAVTPMDASPMELFEPAEETPQEAEYVVPHLTSFSAYAGELSRINHSDWPMSRKVRAVALLNKSGDLFLNPSK